MDVNIRMRLGRFAAILFLSLQVISGHALAESQELTLNFKDADIRALISSVSELTGKNFVVDPRVNGKVTV
ncbi:MAG: hypothetical protein LPH21_12060, partial [Shewanella sp.]|nr:hypothetical protein [Shewanella sp.]